MGSPLARFPGLRDPFAHGLVALAAAGVLSCVLPENHPTDLEFAAARARSPAGALFFAAQCAPCHGARGQGLAVAPQILGAGALPEYARDDAPGRTPPFRDFQQMEIDSHTRRAEISGRDPFRTAQDLYTFLVGHTLTTRAPAATAEDYRAVVTYLLTAQGAAIPADGLTADNAGVIPIPRR
jgi:hypothetical protein